MNGNPNTSLCFSSNTLIQTFDIVLTEHKTELCSKFSHYCNISCKPKLENLTRKLDNLFEFTANCYIFAINVEIWLRGNSLILFTAQF